MLKITAKQLIDSIPAFAELAAAKIQGNPKLAYNLGKTWKAAKVEIDSIREHEVELYKSFGATEREDGSLSLVPAGLPKDKRDAFDAQVKELHAIPVELWGNQITLAEIEKAKIDLSAYQCDTLDWLIVETIAEPEKAAEAAA